MCIRDRNYPENRCACKQEENSEGKYAQQSVRKLRPFSDINQKRTKQHRYKPRENKRKKKIKSTFSSYKYYYNSNKNIKGYNRDSLISFFGKVNQTILFRFFFFEFHFMNVPYAVSYTHLDVYKRQLQYIEKYIQPQHLPSNL